MQTTLNEIFHLEKVIVPKPKVGRPIKIFEYDNFFDKIDAPEKAWVLGWIVTDGHVVKNGNRFAIRLSIEDHKVLEKMQEFFPGSSLSINKEKGDCFLQVTSLRIKQRLIELGIPSGKKSSVCVPIEMEDWLLPHFWRGSFEGDGSVHYANKTASSSGSPVLNFCGAYKMCEGFYNFFNLKNKISNCNGSFIAQKRTTQLEFWQDVKNKFYDDYTMKNGLFLDRKYNKVQEMIARIQERDKD